MTLTELKLIITECVQEAINKDYKGVHTAPDKSKAPLWNMTQLYPDDIYSSEAARFYGDTMDGVSDNLSISIIHSVKGRPNKLVTIYRAVPRLTNNQNTIDDIIKQKKHILATAKFPKNISTKLELYKYYEYLSDELDRLQSLPPESDQEKIKINPGDWVTINKQYAIMHGKSSLNGKYKILSKNVPAKHIFTDADSIHEFGYDPS